MKRFVIAMLAGGLFMPLCTLSASAQRSGDPNIGHFYMARQQWQVIDDAPQINDQRSQPGAAGAMNSGGLNRGNAPLPRAGFNSYSSSMPRMTTGLPEVVNGVPKKLPPSPPPSIGAKSAKAGAYKMPKATAPARPAGPVTAKTYAPVSGYGGGPSMSSGPSSGNGTYGQSSVNSSTGVKGSLLHWSRTR